MFSEAVTPEESALLDRLREIPDGRRREALMTLLMELAAYVHDPRCPRAQGDGVPCLTVSIDCEECQRVPDVLASLRDQLPFR